MLGMSVLNALASSQGFHKQVALDAVFLALHRGASNWVSGLCHALFTRWL